jgi:hypothetical protein
VFTVLLGRSPHAAERRSVMRREEHLEPSDALFNVVEASLALAGFAGIVTALGQRGKGEWRPVDRDRVVNLLLTTLFPFASSLLALTLIYAGVVSVWRVSSAILAVFLLVGGMFRGRPVLRVLKETGASISTFYIAAIYVSIAVLFMLQLANLLRFNTFWPYFGGIALILCIGASQFARLLWFGIHGERAA